MKIIDSSATSRLYQKYNATAPTTEQLAAPKATQSQKIDKISLSGQASRNEELGRLVQDIASELSTGVSASKLEQLKAAVENDEYYVPTAGLADAILDTRG